MILRVGGRRNEWGPQTSGTALALNAVKFTSDLDGWAVGNGGTVLHTTTAAPTGIRSQPAPPTTCWRWMRWHRRLGGGRYGTALRARTRRELVVRRPQARRKSDVRAVTLQTGNVVYSPAAAASSARAPTAA